MMDDVPKIRLLKSTALKFVDPTYLLTVRSYIIPLFTVTMNHIDSMILFTFSKSFHSLVISYNIFQNLLMEHLPLHNTKPLLFNNCYSIHRYNPGDTIIVQAFIAISYLRVFNISWVIHYTVLAMLSFCSQIISAGIVCILHLVWYPNDVNSEGYPHNTTHCVMIIW